MYIMRTLCFSASYLDDLIGMWTFESTATDMLGSVPDGTVGDGVSFDSGGVGLFDTTAKFTPGSATSYIEVSVDT